MARQPRGDTEVDAYVFIKDNLKALGWDTRNPERVATGQVYTQNECLANPEIKRLLILKRPENIVKVTDKTLWVIEAKRSQGELDHALAEAEERAKILNASKLFQVRFISGVAGNQLDGFIVRSRFLSGNKSLPISLNSVEATGLLSPADLQAILASGKPNIQNPIINEKLFLSRADRINAVLHLGAVNPHQRAGVMAALLLSMLSDTGPNVEERSPSILIGDINERVKDVLRRQGKLEFFDYIKISLPASPDNHAKFRRALVETIQELNILNIRSAMNSGADWLGAFYEVFLKYANWAQDLGIVLTPRHITRWAAEVMDIQTNDVVYDPTSGTGGFLVAAFDYVKRRSTDKQLVLFKQNSLFGVEQDSGVAALAVVNMIFRGDGKNNIAEGDCFAKFLERWTNNGIPTAKYVASEPEDAPVTKVMMNPPFALKRSAEKEYKFIDQALRQMSHGGILFSVLPYSAMVRPGGYLNWRKQILLPHHTLLAVVTFPNDLFYPIGVTTVGIFIKKGIPHPKDQKVLWIRCLGDGLLKSKGKRLPNQRASNELKQIEGMLKAFLRNPEHEVPNIQQFHKAARIDFSDKQLELVPEAYLDQAPPKTDEAFSLLEKGMRDVLAYLIKIDKAVLRADLLSQQKPGPFGRSRWKVFAVTDIFDLARGNFHSIADLDAGEYPTISRVSTDNGFVGFYEKPAKAVIRSAKTITVSSVTGDAYVQPTPFIATDNVVLCTLKEPYRNLVELSSLFFIQAMLNHIKWRYSYGRQCYKTKYAKTEVPLPVTDRGDLDEAYMANMVESANHWLLVKAAFGP